MKLLFNNQEILNGKMETPMVFKITYNDDNIITNIEHIKNTNE